MGAMQGWSWHIKGMHSVLTLRAGPRALEKIRAHVRGPEDELRRIHDAFVDADVGVEAVDARGAALNLSQASGGHFGARGLFH